MVELIIPIEFLGLNQFEDPRKAEYMAAAIASMVGTQPVCIFFNNELKIQFTTDQFETIKKFYRRKWRANVTHEVKRHCAINGYKPQLRKMEIVRHN